MCNEVVNVITASKLEGVRKLHNLWHICVKDKITHFELFVKGSMKIKLRNVSMIQVVATLNLKLLI